MNWKECLEKGIITKTESDKERSKQMLEMANTRLKFWNKNIDEEFTALKVEAYYDIIKELVFTHVYKEGFNCKNHIFLFPFPLRMI